MAWTSPTRSAVKRPVDPDAWDELARLESQSPGLTRFPGKPEAGSEVVPIGEVKHVLLATGVGHKQVQSVMKSLRAKLATRKSPSRKRVGR
jgi:hypothetical protein